MLITKLFPRYYFDKDEGAGGTPAGQGAGKTTTNDATPETGDEAFDKDRAMTTIRALRLKEKELEKLQKAEEDRKREQLSETDRVKAEKSELEKKLAAAQSRAKTTAARAEVITAAAKAGFADPDDAWNLLRESLTVSDDGQVEGLDKALTALSTAKPYLVKGASGGQSASPAPGKQPSPGNPGKGNRLSLDDIRKMSTDEIAQRWNDAEFRKDLADAQKQGG